MRPSTASAPFTTSRWRSRPTTSSGGCAKNCSRIGLRVTEIGSAATSSPSTSASRAACCSRSPPSGRGSPIDEDLAHARDAPEAAAVGGTESRGRSNRAAADAARTTAEHGPTRRAAGRRRRGAARKRRTAVVIIVHGRNAAREHPRPRAARSSRTGRHVPGAGRRRRNTLVPATASWPRLEQNEPGLSSGLPCSAARRTSSRRRRFHARGSSLLGFSQGACLTAEFAGAARVALRRRDRVQRRLDRPAGDAVGLRRGASTARRCFSAAATSTRTSRRRACTRARRSSRRLGAEVTERIYPGMGHLVNDDEIAWAQGLLDAVAQGASAIRGEAGTEARTASVALGVGPSAVQERLRTT